MFPSFFSNKDKNKDKDYKMIAHNICCIINKEPLTGTAEQQKKAWDMYVSHYCRFVDLMSKK